MTRTQSRAAAVFVDWIGRRVTPQVAARYGYRPGDPALRPAAPIDRGHLVDPAQPRVVLGPPEPRVLAKIKRAWHADRKAANVAVVVDVSGSMQDEDKLRQAQDGLQVFLRQFSPRDRVGLVTFADTSRVIVPIAEMGTNRINLERWVENLVAGGGTAVYDATSQSVDLIASLRDSTRINAVVVLTAATRRLNIAVPAGIVLAAFVLEALWLLPIALVVYAALVVTAVLDGDVAEAVGHEVYAKARGELPKGAASGVTPAVAEKLDLARAEERRIHKAIDESTVPLVDVATEVDRLMQALETLARQADRVSDYLHIAATLGAVHAQIVRMSVEEEASEQGRVAGRVRDLRREVGAAADAMQEAYRDLE